MSQPVKLSTELILDARIVSKRTERSIAGQIEFWARLGRAIEPLLTSEKVLALKDCGDQIPLSELLASVDSAEGRQRVTDFLSTQPYPHYELAADGSGLLVRIEESGARTVGRFVNKEFKPVKASNSAAKKLIESPVAKSKKRSKPSP